MGIGGHRIARYQVQLLARWVPALSSAFQRFPDLSRPVRAQRSPKQFQAALSGSKRTLSRSLRRFSNELMKTKLIRRYLHAHEVVPVVDLQHHPLQLAGEQFEGGAAIQVSIETGCSSPSHRHMANGSTENRGSQTGYQFYGHTRSSYLKFYHDRTSMIEDSSTSSFQTEGTTLLGKT